MRIIWVLALLCGTAFASNPVVIATDLDSGPNTGNSDTTYCSSAGAYVTVFGKFFGATQGASSITFGSGAVACVVSWSDTVIVVALGGSSATGAVVVTVGGNASNTDVTFTIDNTGHIYYGTGTGANATSTCVSPRTGSFSSQWIVHNAANTSTTRDLEYFENICLAAGDILYLLDGVTQSFSTGQHQPVTIRNSGTQGHPIAIGNYPGGTWYIDTAAGDQYIMRASGTCTGPSLRCAWHTFFGGHMTNTSTAGLGGVAFGSTYALSMDGVRFINNYVTCTNCTSPSGAVEIKGDYVTIAMNEMTLVSTNLANTAVSKQFHTAYMAGNHIYFVGNYTHDNNSCNALQVHDDGQVTTGGFYDVHVYGNRMRDQLCSCLNLSTMNPQSGTVEAYNNVWAHCGNNVTLSESANTPHACVLVKDQGLTSSVGTIDLSNNSMYDCTAVLNVVADNVASAVYKGSGATHQANVTVQMRNNIIQLPTYTNQTAGTYCASGTYCADFTGSKNNWYGGAGSIPANLTSNVTTDPLYTNVSINDFTLQTTSPAKNGGNTIVSIVDDILGYVRPQNTTYSLGAYEVPSGGVVTTTKLTAVGGVVFVGHVVIP